VSGTPATPREDVTHGPAGTQATALARPGLGRARLRAGASRLVDWGAAPFSICLFIAIWQAVVVVFSLPDYVLPAPAAVFDELTGSAAGPLWSELGTTTIEVIEGFVVATVVGVLIAVIIAASRVAERLIYPMLVILQAVPKVAIAPLFLAWFGLGTEPRILVAGLLAIFPIIINTSVGLIGVDPGLLTLARSTGAKAHRVFWQVRLPAALPSFFAGLKLGIALAVVGAVVGEFIGGDSGLGFILMSAQGNLNIALAFAALTLLAALGVVLFYAVVAVESFLVRWR
jgi:NitT/TauT family transport system permease protein